MTYEARYIDFGHYVYGSEDYGYNVLSVTFSAEVSSRLSNDEMRRAVTDLGQAIMVTVMNHDKDRTDE